MQYMAFVFQIETSSSRKNAWSPPTFVLDTMHFLEKIKLQYEKNTIHVHCFVFYGLFELLVLHYL